MTTRYSSFLIRYWHLTSGARRITVEHVQSGEEAILPTLDAAAGWIGARGGAGPDPARAQCPEASGAATSRAANESGET
jgi:hypothetical protein